MSWIELVAVVFGLLCVWQTVKQNIWCWPTGLVQVVLYIVIFYQVKLYSDMFLQVVYVVLQFYGWYNWMNGGKNRTELPVSRISTGKLAFWAAASVAGTFLWGYGMATYTDAACPYWDAFVVVASLIAQWMMTRKELESWLFWVSVDVVAIGVYLYKDLYLTSGLYAIFLVMAISGFFAWKKALKTTGTAAI